MKSSLFNFVQDGEINNKNNNKKEEEDRDKKKVSTRSRKISRSLSRNPSRGIIIIEEQEKIYSTENTER